MSKSLFYHAGCPVCISAEQEILSLIDKTSVRIIHLGEQKDELKVVEQAGVKSVPALVTPSGSVLHINFGASIEDLKN